jgi:membrane-bound inhibitor of C-type lysozyme
MDAKILFAPSINKSFALSVFAATLLVSTVLRAQQPDPNPIPPPAQPAPESPNAPTAPVAPSGSHAGSSPSSHLMRTWRRLTYTCDADAKVVVNVHAKEARLVFEGKTYNLQQVDETDGQKYSGSSLVWRLKDDVGTLKRSAKSGAEPTENKPLAAGCHLQSEGTNPSTPSAKTPPNSH